MVLKGLEKSGREKATNLTKDDLDRELKGRKEGHSDRHEVNILAGIERRK